MTVQIPLLFGETPNKVESVSSKSEELERYIWYLRNKSEKGLHIKLEPSTDDWLIEFYTVKWNGTDYIEGDKPIFSSVSEDYDSAIQETKKNVKSICEEKEEFRYISKALKNL